MQRNQLTVRFLRHLQRQLLALSQTEAVLTQLRDVLLREQSVEVQSIVDDLSAIATDSDRMQHERQQMCAELATAFTLPADAISLTRLANELPAELQQQLHALQSQLNTAARRVQGLQRQTHLLCLERVRVGIQLMKWMSDTGPGDQYDARGQLQSPRSRSFVNTEC